jgi:CelD/BcsL family acetyltransferase involved in cellulose biosynthesis
MARNDTIAARIPLRRERVSDAVPRRAVTQAQWQPLSALDASAPEWRELTRHALEPNVFYDPAFALAAAPVFGANAGAVLVHRNARLIGFFPGRVERRYGVMATLTGWTHPYAPLGVPLVDRGDAEAAIEAFLDYVGAEGPRLVLLPMLTRDGAFAVALRRVLARRGGATAEFGSHARALLEPAQDRAAYLDHALAHKKRKELRRQRRRLAETGAVTLATAQEPAAVTAALDDFLKLEAGGWKGRAGSAAFARAPLRAFLERAVTALAADGHARVDRLMQEGRALAATITLCSGGTAWFWKIAYHEAFARASPGVQIALDLTDALLADAGTARVDSCATAGHPMIDHLWRERLALNDLLIAPGRDALSAFGVACKLEPMRRAAFAAAKRMRDALRRGA